MIIHIRICIHKNHERETVICATIKTTKIKNNLMIDIDNAKINILSDHN